MHIHIFQNGENLFSVASKYKISPSRLVEENQLHYPYNTIAGQSIFISRPNAIHFAKASDTPEIICDQHHISYRNFYQYNPGIFGNSRLFPGQNIVISPEQSHFGSISIAGYIEEDQAIQPQILPYLTMLTIDGCTINNGNLTIPSIPLLSNLKKDIMPLLLAGIDGDSILHNCPSNHVFLQQLVKSISDSKMSGLDIFIKTPLSISQINALKCLRTHLKTNNMRLFAHISSKEWSKNALEYRKIITLADAVLLRDNCENIGFATWIKYVYNQNNTVQAYVFPSLPCRGFQCKIERSDEGISLPINECFATASAQRCSLSRSFETHYAYYDFTAGFGRRKKQYRISFDDAFSVSLGMLEMNRIGVSGVSVNAAETPVSFLFMLSTYWQIIDNTMLTF